MAETLTEINSLKKYGDGEHPGASSLNANWDAIDKRLLNAATSNPATYPVGGFLLRTDLKKLYENTGTHDVPVWTLRLDGSISSGHTHVESDVTNLVADLATLTAAAAAAAAAAALAAKRTYVFVSPDELSTDADDNELIPWLPGAGQTITDFLAVVKTAPTGADIHIDFYIGTLSTGALGASIATVTIAAGAYTGSASIAATSVGTDKFLAMKVNQVGSTIIGSDLTAIAR